MTTAEKSITRVLAELKSIDQKLALPSAFGAVAGLAVGQGSNPTVTQGFGGELPRDKAAAEKAITANLNQIVGLMNRRQVLKAAVIKSNAETTVSVGGRSMTVAEAIELKSRIATLEALVNYVRGQVNVANARNVQAEREVEALIQSQVSTLLANAADKSDLSKITEDISRPIYAQKRPAAMTEAATAFVERYAAELETLRTEIDFVLSESNAKTVIYV